MDECNLEHPKVPNKLHTLLLQEFLILDSAQKQKFLTWSETQELFDNIVFLSRIYKSDISSLLTKFYIAFNIKKMKKKELEVKYGKNLISKIFAEGYLDGCTIAIINGEEDIPEEDIVGVIRELRGEKIGLYDWD